jgi:glycosyltransferase involved in cell wall biosynthesis
MRTLHIDTEKTWRGGEQQALYLVRGLLARGHVAEVLCQPESAFGERAARIGAAVRTAPMRSDVDAFGVAGIMNTVKRHGYELLHLHTSRAHMLGCVAARLLGRTVRTVVSRRVDFSTREKGSPFSGFKYRFGVDRYIAISEAVRDVLVRDGVHRERIRIVHSGIDPERLRPEGRDVRAALGIPNEAPVVGVVGHFADHKGHRFLLDAFPRILEAQPEARLLLVGEGELRDALQKQAGALGIGSRVIFAGFRTDVPDCLLAMDVVAAPSVQEGLNTSVLDALYLERPVVASRVGGLPEAVRHDETGLLAPPGDSARLAEGVLQLLGDRDRARALGRAGRERVERIFTAAAMVEGTLGVYRELLNGRRPA